MHLKAILAYVSREVAAGRIEKGSLPNDALDALRGVVVVPLLLHFGRLNPLPPSLLGKKCHRRDIEP